MTEQALPPGAEGTLLGSPEHPCVVVAANRVIATCWWLMEDRGGPLPYVAGAERLKRVPENAEIVLLGVWQARRRDRQQMVDEIARMEESGRWTIRRVTG